MIFPANPPTEAIDAVVDTRDCEEQALPLSTACAIKSIVAEPNTVAAENLFLVTVADEAGGEFTARMTADELVTYEDFQAALLSRFGAGFDDRGRFTGHHGLDRWQSHIYDHLGSELPA